MRSKHVHIQTGALMARIETKVGEGRARKRKRK